MSQPETVSHVLATFGARRMKFELPRRRDVVDALEQEIGSISAAWGRFRGGNWTIADVRSVIRAAHPWLPESQSPAGIRHGRTVAEVSHFLSPSRDTPLPTRLRPASVNEIDHVLQGRPLATYAPLAAAILSAAFVGLPEKDAAFDEGRPILAEAEQEEHAA